ncbi:MAG TPA: helix-turn-helix transcriptional regulator [Clostridiales bacterium]|nr:helix-turn-helix transcriptional regulator [Clostridiales bacterium]
MPQKNNIMAVFSERLKTLREEAGLTQKELGEQLDISRGSIGFYENGERVPDIAFLDAAANYFEVSTEYLLGRTDIKSSDLDMKEICEKTGLSEKSISSILRLKDLDNSLDKLEGEDCPFWMSNMEMLNYIAGHYMFRSLVSEAKIYILLSQKKEDFFYKTWLLTKKDPEWEEFIQDYGDLWEKYKEDCDLHRYRCEKHLSDMLSDFHKKLVEINFSDDEFIAKKDELELFLDVNSTLVKAQNIKKAIQEQMGDSSVPFVLNNNNLDYYKNSISNYISGRDDAIVEKHEIDNLFSVKEGDPDGNDTEKE